MSYYSLYLLLGHLIVSVSSCTRGDVRLEDGSTRFEGRVEVCIDGGWRIICDNFWDPPDAKVVCRQLGFLEISLRNETINAHVTGERFGRGPSRSINSVECRSNDERLLECNYSTISPPTCLSAGVRCMEGASPTNLSYFKRDTNVVLTWSPTNISTAITSRIDPLTHYTATCISDTDENYQHLSQVLVNMNTLNTTISGLNLMDFDYNCCVSADYGSYHPKTCLRVNRIQFVLNTCMEGAPQNIRYVIECTSSLIMTWRYPQTNLSNCVAQPILSYTIMCATTSNDSYQHVVAVNVTNTTTHVRIGGLSISTVPYTCCITAVYNVKSQGCIKIEKTSQECSTDSVCSNTQLTLIVTSSSLSCIILILTLGMCLFFLYRKIIHNTHRENQNDDKELSCTPNDAYATVFYHNDAYGTAPAS